MKANNTLLSIAIVAFSLALPGLLFAAAGANPPVEQVDPNWIMTLALLGIGIFCLVLEFTVIPGFGIAGVLGICATSVGLFLLTRDAAAMGMEVSPTSLTAIGSGIVGAVGGTAGLVFGFFKILPSVPGAKNVIHSGAVEKSETEHQREIRELVGMTGVARTDLRPSGKISLAGRDYDVTASDGYIEAGEQVIVDKCKEGHLEVRRFA